MYLPKEASKNNFGERGASASCWFVRNRGLTPLRLAENLEFIRGQPLKISRNVHLSIYAPN
jgi:hypothetical protein